MKHRRDGHRGQVLPLFALFLVVLLGTTAIAVDYGSWLKGRRDYQNVADAAVLAGGGFLSRPIDATKRTQARRAAWESLNNQLALGLTTGQLNTLQTSNTPAGTPSVFASYRIWVSTPPIGSGANYPGAFTGASDRYLFAWIEKDDPAFFSQVLGIGNRTVSAWATAGVFAGQFAVITLRQNGQRGPANATDITLAGTGVTLQVANGDVGGNWGMKLNSGSNLYLTGDADAYLVDYTSCGNSCWSANQVNDGSPTFNLKTPLQLPNIVDDPNYPLPAAFPGNPPASGGTGALPKASGTANSPASKVGDVTITKGAIVGTGCSPTSPRIGPGWYHDINVNNGACVVLDPTHNYSDPNDDNNDGDFGVTNVPSTQQAGIFYITGTFNVNNGSLAVGDGVSLVLRQTANQPSLTANGSASIDVNTGATDGTKGFPPDLRKAAFKTDGSYSYSFDTSSGTWQYTASNTDKSTVGVAVYVVKPSQMGDLTTDANTDQVQVQAGSALSWQGVLYAPHDNIALSGQPLHDAIGQFICWTVKLSGGTTVVQTYDGPGESTPRLVEPRLGQ
jgi:hypothetical protein